MKETVLAIFASPHKNGNTAALLNAFVDDMEFENIIQINLFDAPPIDCDDCGYCKKVEGCSKNDMALIYEYLEKAQILIFAFPVYNMSVPAPLKALLDRMQRYYNARFVLNKRPPIETPKKVIILSSCGRSEEKVKEIVLAPFKSILTIINASLCSVVFLDNTDKEVLQNRVLELSKNVAEDLKHEFSF